MSKIDKFIIITTENLGIGIDPNKNVIVDIRGIGNELGFAPGVALGVQFSPSEARQFAQALIRKADEAEEKSLH